jgi:methylthioribose-1-phosphate isomerase
VDGDGSVTFSDLTAEMLDVARELDPDASPVCATRPGASGTGEIRPVRLEADSVVMLDQRLLPHREVWVRLRTASEVAAAIRDMVVRGAPAIGISAAMGMVLASQEKPEDPFGIESDLQGSWNELAATRPTAVNLHWALDRMAAVMDRLRGKGSDAIRQALRDEALSIEAEDVAMNRAMGRHGADLIPDGATVLTHCNAGALATGGYGTALGVIRAARESGKTLRVVSCETRPYLQGARLTAWELVRDGFDVTLITDNAAGHLMATGQISCAIVGADRIALNGDTANKIGTYTHAVVAKRHGIPFYVAAPTSTIDLDCDDGSGIPIEERDPSEVLFLGGVRVAAEGVKVRNPAFDVTPWELIGAIVTERGVHRPQRDGYDFTLPPPGTPRRTRRSGAGGRASRSRAPG